MNISTPAADPDNTIAHRIRTRILDEGFDVCGITSSDEIPEARQALHKFLDNGWHGSMDWMAKNVERRANPKTLWPSARSVIVAGMNYGPQCDPLLSLSARSQAKISVHAQGKDYHNVLLKRLKAVARWIHQDLHSEVKVFVDTAPVMEKPLAAAAGIGWQGKHTNLVAKDYGSWLFIGSIFTTLELGLSQPHKNYCGTCAACINICPTAAFPKPYKLNATSCISYLTIEHKGHIPNELRKPIGNRIYGCDDCLAVCPWNKFAQKTKMNMFLAKKGLGATPLKALAKLDDTAFRQRFSGTAIKRIGRDRFLRNVLIAIGNSNDSSLLKIAEGLLTDVSPLVRAMAIWACSELAPPQHLRTLFKIHVEAETDNDVFLEWQSCLDASS